MKDKSIILIIACSILLLAILGLVISNVYANKSSRNKAVSIFNDAESFIEREIEKTKKEIEESTKKLEDMESGIFINGQNIEDDKDVKKRKVSITLKSQEGSDESATISAEIKYLNSETNKDESNVSFDMIFEKETGVLANRDAIYTDEVARDNDIKEIVDEIIEKCINEKLYNVTTLSMSYSYNKFEK